MNYNYNNIMKIRFRPISVFLTLCLLLGFFSCSREEPQIVFGFIELVYYSGINDVPEERFTFFIIPEDDDGVDNLSELYLYHDRDGLSWLITSDDWIVHEEDGITWIGTRSIAMNENATLPRGQYRAVLINQGGESTERRFTFDGPDSPPYPFPGLTIAGGNYQIESEYPVNHFVGYDAQGRVVQTLTVSDHEGSVWNLRLSSSVRSVALWAEEPEFHISEFTSAVPLR